MSVTRITDGNVVGIAGSKVTGVSGFDDNDIINDLSTLAIRQASTENKTAYDTASMYVDVFQDATGITGLTQCARSVDKYMSSIYFVSGQFTADANTKFLLHSDTANGSTTFTDSTGSHSITANGNVQHSTTKQKFGTTSIKFDGNGDSLQIPDHTDFDFVGDFTLEFWFNKDNNSVNQMMYGRHNPALASYFFTFRAGAGVLRLSDQSNGSHPSSMGSNLNNGVWHHLAHTRTGTGSNNCKVYIDGSQVHQYSGNNQMWQNGWTSDIWFGTYGTSAEFFEGYLDEIRVSNIGRYTSNFTPAADANVANATGSFEGNTITASSSVSSMGAVITYQDQSGTNALNSDIVLKLSADGGSNYATATLTAMPDFDTGIKMAKVNDLSVTAGTSLKYKIEFANQASGSKEARIRGVSLQY